MNNLYLNYDPNHKYAAFIDAEASVTDLFPFNLSKQIWTTGTPLPIGSQNHNFSKVRFASDL